MLKSIRIKNFQSHKKTLVKLNEGFNVILGPSDNGKSAVIRAVRWNVFNTHFGAFIHNGQTDCKVTLSFDNCSVVRYKDKSKNQYSLIINKEKTEFNAVGVKVPIQIEQVLNFKEINFSNQLDSHFLLTDTPGARGRYINELVNLDIIDRAVSRISQQQREVNNEIKFITGQKENKEIELQKYKWIENASNELDKIQKGKTKLVNLEKRSGELEELLYGFKKVEKEIKTSFGSMKACNTELDQLNNMISDLQQKQKQYESLLTIRTDLRNTNSNRGIVLKQIEEKEVKLSTIMASNPICPLCGAKKKNG